MKKSGMKTTEDSMLRNYRKNTDEPRKVRKISYTDKEMEIAQQVAHNFGLKSFADIPLFLADHMNELEAYADAQIEKRKLELRPLATYVNQIEAGINVEESKDIIVAKVKEMLKWRV